MKKYSTDKKPVMVLKNVKFDQDAIMQVMEIHDNFSEFVRDAVDKHIESYSPIITLYNEGLRND